jgi:hypothetical protein
VSASTKEPWLLATGTHGDTPMVLRLRTAPPLDAERAVFPLLVMIRWPFEPDGDDALPDEDDLETMIEFEEALDAAMNEQGWGRLVAVVTAGGTREWRIYTQDLDRFQEGLNEALIGRPRYPLDFETFEDPDWGGYAELANGLDHGNA